MIETILTFFFGVKCEECGSRNLDHGYWIRGWNNLCEQATGDDGTRCYDCGNIVWDRSIEAYRESLPDWCFPYDGKSLTKRSITK